MSLIAATPAPLPAVTRWRTIIVCHVLAALLFLSWYALPGKPAWERLDEAVFTMLNGGICHAPHALQVLVAFMNTHLFDAMSAGVMIGLMLLYVVWPAVLQPDTGKTPAERAGIILYAGLFMLVVIVLRRQTGLMEFDRPSPTRVLEYCDLRDFMSVMTPKVSAGNSFPSDHFIAAIFFAVLMARLCGRRWFYAALALAPFFFVPRIIGGAHWLSDGVIGTASFSLVALSWGLFTPLTGRAVAGLTAFAARIMPRLPFIK